MPWYNSVFPDALPRQAFHNAALRLARECSADLFLSGAGYSGENRSLCALEPLDELVIDDATPTGTIRDFCFGTPGPALGWLGYELGMRLRGLSITKPCTLPQGVLRKYACVMEHDAASNRLRIHGKLPPIRTEPLLSGASEASLMRISHVHASFSREAYMDGVRQTLERIRDGHSYQLNLSIAFAANAAGLDPLEWFTMLLQRHPAPFYAWFGYGPHRLLSTSPERFLQVQGGEVLSQPIKGTLRLPANPNASALPDATPLLHSPKEDAELSMIVDLLRNDISTHCAYGSVRVERHKSVFRVDNLLQMYSDVRGTLRKDATCLDLLLDAFPGGSVTGCPKQRSMQIIDALEPHSREVYCGSFVIIEDEKNMDSSIAIRTARHDTESEKLLFHAGSGIVIDSDPESEYLETLAKAEKFLGGAYGALH